ncbi:MAG TPA: hypothetical protein VFL90_18005 [Methylomirabilota bacterium]|nr:hypothetical protein [Methylomirabilota bacterium]
MNAIVLALAALLLAAGPALAQLGSTPSPPLPPSSTPSTAAPQSPTGTLPPTTTPQPFGTPSQVNPSTGLPSNEPSVDPRTGLPSASPSTTTPGVPNPTTLPPPVWSAPSPPQGVPLAPGSR